MKARRGYTIIEMLVVLAVLGVLATIAMPYYWDTRYRAIAANIVSDYNSVRVASLSYHANHATLPATHAWSTVPAEFTGMLPDSTNAFAQGAYEYRWYLWTGASLGGEFAAQGLVAGMGVRSSDPRIIEAIRNTYQGRYIATTPEEVTLIIR